MRNHKLVLTWIGLLSLLGGCGPVLRTNYTYLPPATSDGKACVFQCENTKLQCKRVEDLDYQQCRDRADYRYDLCEERNRYRREDDREYCYRSYCTRPSYSRCEETYRSCYQTCGGTVQSETVCVSNCEEYYQQQGQTGGNPADERS